MANGTSKHRPRKSDSHGEQRESLRVGFDKMMTHYGAIKAISDTADFRRRRREELHGANAYSCDSRLCACGKPALRTWHNVGYCKAHAPERLP